MKARFRPLVRCAGIGCETLTDPERGPICSTCRRFKADKAARKLTKEQNYKQERAR